MSMAKKTGMVLGTTVIAALFYLMNPAYDALAQEQAGKAKSRLEETVQKEARLFTEVNNSNYKSEVLNYDGPALVMFYTSNYERGPASEKMNDVFRALAKEFRGKKDPKGKEVKFCRYDYEKNIRLKGVGWRKGRNIMAKKYGGITEYPTTIMYAKGKDIDRRLGGVADDHEGPTFRNMKNYWICPLLLGIPNPDGDGKIYKYNNTSKIQEIK